MKKSISLRKLKTSKYKRKTKKQKFKKTHKQLKKHTLSQQGGNMEKLSPLLIQLQQFSKIIPVMINNNKKALIIITNNDDIYTGLCTTIENFLKEIDVEYNKKESLTEKPPVPYIWFFHGTVYSLYDRTKAKRNFYEISVEKELCLNIDLAIETYLTTTFINKTIQLFELNIFGQLVFNLLLKYTGQEPNWTDLYNKIYNKDKNTLNVKASDLIDFLKKTSDIFMRCHPFYKYISGNLLKDMLSFCNPSMTSMDEMSGSPAYFNSYNDLESELNALCLETSIGNPDTIQFPTEEVSAAAAAAKTIPAPPLVKTDNLRCILNMIILIFNAILTNNGVKGVCTKSGGEVYRYYGDKIPYTNDIDTKIFYSSSLNKEEKIDIQKNLILLLILLTIYIKNNNNIVNFIKRIQPKYIHFGDLLIKASFETFKIGGVETNYNTRVRSKFISGVRLFSIDVYIGTIFELSETPIKIQAQYINEVYNSNPIIDSKRKYLLDRPIHVINSYTTVAPLDVANINNMSYEEIMYKDYIVFVDTMPILSKKYLIHDIQILLQRPERESKRDKDISRMNLLEDVMEEKNPTTNPILNVCVEKERYKEFYEKLRTIKNNSETYVLTQLDLFIPTLHDDTTSYRTPLNTGDISQLDLYQ